MGNRLYIVDYDIPEEPAKEKVQFYRDMQKLRKEYPHGDYSTLSVFRTEEKTFAQAVYWLVVAHGGCAHIYYGEEITEDLGL